MEILNIEEVQKQEDYLLVEKAIKYIEDNYGNQPSLEEIALSVNLSKYHFQRIFTRWAGISPTKFMQYITISHAKDHLLQSRSILETSNKVGLSSSGRLYDLFVSFEAMTPGEYAKCGESLIIYYGFHNSQFGQCLIALTNRGICHMSFIEEGSKEIALEQLKEQWDKSQFIEEEPRTREVVDSIFSVEELSSKNKIKLLLKGTNFQIKVWEALLKIDFGKLVSYKDIALMIGSPSASRAVGTAVGKNNIAYIIPCHRVIRDCGVINNYRWGSARKKLLIGWETAQTALSNLKREK
jgi:AraC family transcriptional regulator, regulatory protein of adaptative response / methylated-DNA-[protein]-cysteine methyltransferase